MTQEEKVTKIMENFTKEIDKVFEGTTPKIEGTMDALYECDIYIYRHKGMGNSKQIIFGNPLSIITATTSYLEMLLRQGLIDKKQLKEMTKLACKAANGKI